MKTIIVLLVVVLAFLAPVGALGDIARTNVSSSAQTADPLVWSHTVAVGSDRYLVVDVAIGNSTHTISGVTYNGVPMTEIGAHIAGNSNIKSYGLVTPAEGAHNVSVDFSQSTAATGLAVSYTGIDQTTPYAAAADTGRTWALTLQRHWSGGDSGDWIHTFFSIKATQTSLTPGSGQTENVEELTNPSGVSSYKPAVAGNDLVSYSGNAAGNCALVTFAINAAGAAEPDTCCTATGTSVGVLAYGAVDTGQVDTLSLIINNCSSGSEAFADSFDLTTIAAPFALLGSDKTYSLAAGVSDTFQFTFTPTSVESFADTLTVGFDSCGIVVMTGTGAEVGAPVVCCSVLLDLLQFGSVDTMQSDDLLFNVKNCGDVTLNDAVEPSTIAPPFSLVETDSTYNLLAGDSITFHIRFAPTEVGSFADTLGTGHDSCGVVIMTGTGTTPGVPSNRAFYMHPDGVNSLARDGSRTEPYQTLQWIVRNVHTPGWGDTVMVMSGTHAGSAQAIGYNCRVRGHPDSFFVIMADPLGATMPIIDAAWSTNACWAFYARYTEAPWYNNNPDDDVAYVKVKGIHFMRANEQCLYFVDGGMPDAAHDSRGTPAHHIVIEDCILSESADQYHVLKFSGVDTFLIQNCDFYNGADPFFDGVGIHYGTIRDCTFRDNDTTSARWYDPVHDPKGAGIVIKGGSNKVTVYRCWFDSPGFSGINIGQQTGCYFSRPQIGTTDGDGNLCDYQAKDVSVYACVFRRCRAAIDFNNSNGGLVCNNTFYNPNSRLIYPGGHTPITDNIYLGPDAVVRITAQRHYACDTSQCECPGGVGWMEDCHDGYFLNNIAYFGTPLQNWSGEHFTIFEKATDGYFNSLPETFRFSYNLWHHPPDTSLSMPPWSYYASKENTSGCPSNGMNHTGNPMFAGVGLDEPIDFRLQSSSPAAKAGSLYVNMIYDWYNEEYIDGTDYDGNAWGDTMAIGAFSAGGGAPPLYACCSVQDIDFGNVYVENTVVDSFSLYNCGDSILTDTISPWTVDAAYTLHTDSAYVLGAGETKWFVVHFAPTEQKAYPASQDTGHPECANVVFSGVGLGTTVCNVVDTTIAFGSVAIDQTATDSFYIKNEGYFPLNDAISGVGLNPVYTLISDSTYSLTTGDSMSFVVRFAPTAVVEYLDTIDTGHSACTDVALSGTGTLQALCCTTTGIAFGGVYVDSTAVDSFSIHNCGSTTLVDSIDWACDPVYTLMSDSAYSIASGNTDYFVVGFTPTAEVYYPEDQGAGHASCSNIVLSGAGIALPDSGDFLTIIGRIVWVSPGVSSSSATGVFNISIPGGVVLGPGCIVPMVFGVTEDPDTSNCIITWSTDLNANHQVGYKRLGLGSWDYTPATPEGNTTSHACTLTNLEYGVHAYEFAVRSTTPGDTTCTYGWQDADSFLTLCGTDGVFLTQSIYEFFSNVYCLWTTAEGCDQSGVCWREAGGSWNYCSWQNHGERKAHEKILCGLTPLKPSLTYQYRVRNRDMCGNAWSYGPIWSFNTDAGGNIIQE